MVEISSEELGRMSENDIVLWAWNVLGAPLDPKWPKTRLLSEIMRYATDAR